MWNMVRKLRENGVTIILTTHYIEEAEEMADRIGVMRDGEIILVEDKTRLMSKLGKKELRLHLQNPLEKIPGELTLEPVELSSDGYELIYSFDSQEDQAGVARLLRMLSDIGIEYRDLQTRESSLEDIFVNLVHE
jgi:ABC-2 type transport system ATP-binding protein